MPKIPLSNATSAFSVMGHYITITPCKTRKPRKPRKIAASTTTPRQNAKLAKSVERRAKIVLNRSKAAERRAASAKRRAAAKRELNLSVRRTKSKPTRLSSGHRLGPRAKIRADALRASANAAFARADTYAAADVARAARQVVASDPTATTTAFAAAARAAAATRAAAAAAATAAATAAAAATASAAAAAAATQTTTLRAKCGLKEDGGALKMFRIACQLAREDHMRRVAEQRARNRGNVETPSPHLL